MLKSLLVILLILVLINSFSLACAGINQTTENMSTIKPNSIINQSDSLDEQRYLLKHDNGIFSDSYCLWDPRGLCVSYSPPVTPFKINKIFIRGYRTDFPNAEGKTYTVKIWDGDFGKELYSYDYPYSKFSTNATMVEHTISPPLIVTDNFTVDFISHSESVKEGAKPNIAIYITYDNTLSINEHSGISWLGKYDDAAVERVIKKNPKYLYAAWMIQIEGSGQASSGKPQAIITVTENISAVVDGSYFAPFPCSSTHAEIKEARNLIKDAMARRQSLTASAFGHLIGEERNKMYEAIEILEHCASKLTENDCEPDDRNATLSSLYNDIGYCHTFLQNENFASDYYYRAIKVNPNNNWAAANIQATKEILLPNKIVHFNLSQ
ncbi:MAG: hypothetical protein WC169_01080 [Dehalococcoidia bacterium]|jgi:hypothetical protein